MFHEDNEKKSLQKTLEDLHLGTNSLVLRMH